MDLLQIWPSYGEHMLPCQVACCVSKQVSKYRYRMLHALSHSWVWQMSANPKQAQYHCLQEPFVDFGKSDLRARAMLIKASFDVFTIMQRRGFQVLHSILPCDVQCCGLTQACYAVTSIPQMSSQMRRLFLGYDHVCALVLASGALEQV